MKAPHTKNLKNIPHCVYERDDHAIQSPPVPKIDCIYPMAVLTQEFQPVKSYAAWNKLSTDRKLSMWKASVIEYLTFDLGKVVGFDTEDGLRVNRYNGEGWLVISEGTKEKVQNDPSIMERLRLVRRHPLVESKDTKGENIFQLVAPGGVTYDDVATLFG